MGIVAHIAELVTWIRKSRRIASALADKEHERRVKVGEVGMTRDEIITGLEREIKSIRMEPRRKMIGFCMTATEAEDVIALLKEQNAVVRCKDCKHYDPDCQSCDNGLDGIFTPDWFCADGEPKERT